MGIRTSPFIASPNPANGGIFHAGLALATQLLREGWPAEQTQKVIDRNQSGQRISKEDCSGRVTLRLLSRTVMATFQVPLGSPASAVNFTPIEVR
jgi:hypothetical protein